MTIVDKATKKKSFLSNEELSLIDKIRVLKQQAGSHSPGIFEIAKKIPEINVKVDACFLSNPYANKLFMDWMWKDLIETQKLNSLLEFYPSQNRRIAEYIEPSLKISADQIIIGNGATELIQAVLHNFANGRVLVNIPTFSPYYEFVDPEKCDLLQTEKSNNYQLDVDAYCKKLRGNQHACAIVINPNNPDGGFLSRKEIERVCEAAREIETLIIDESFVHFAYENEEYHLVTYSDLIKRYPNLVILKSMSKDFGVAGLRAGYAVMDSKRVTALLSRGYLWNSNGLAEYFFSLFLEPSFLQEYEKVRLQYLVETQEFFVSCAKELTPLGFKVIPSKANFVLIELPESMEADAFSYKLLLNSGIYVRSAKDKIGLMGEYMRVASRSKSENEMIKNAILSISK